MSRWSKKDYEMVAQVISELHHIGEGTDAHRYAARRFALIFGNDSDTFNRALFLKACGVTE